MIEHRDRRFLELDRLIALGQGAVKRTGFPPELEQTAEAPLLLPPGSSSVTADPDMRAIVRYMAMQERTKLIRVMESAAHLFNLTPTELRMKTNAAAIVLPRSLAMYVMSRSLGMSSSAIGRVFGGKDHTTVLHAVKKIELLRRADQDMEAAIQLITEAAGISGLDRGQKDTYQVEITLP